MVSIGINISGLYNQKSISSGDTTLALRESPSSGINNGSTKDNMKFEIYRCIIVSFVVDIQTRQKKIISIGIYVTYFTI